MELRLLLDEDTERDLAQKLRRAGHDVDRVVDVDALGTGAADAEVRTYAFQTDRMLITHDDDHVAASTQGGPTILYCPNQRLDSFRLFRIVQAVTEQYRVPNSLPSVVFLTERWLD